MAQKVTMVSNGGGEVGAAKLTGEVLDIMTRLPAAVEKLTGINISQVSVCGSERKIVFVCAYTVCEHICRQTLTFSPLLSTGWPVHPNGLRMEPSD